MAQALGIVIATRGGLRLELAIALGVGVLVHGCAWRGTRARALLALLLAAAAGAVSAGLAAARAGPPLEHPWQGILEGTVGSISRGGERWSIDLERVVAIEEGAVAIEERVVAIEEEPGAARGPVARAPVPARVRLRGEPGRDEAAGFGRVPVGARVRARVRLRPPGGLRNPGGRDGARALRRAGIGAEGRLAAPQLFARLPARDSTLTRLGLHPLRARLGERLAASGPGGALLRALALGDRGGIASDDREAFAVLGLSHLLAVSGLHLALVAAGAFTVLRWAAGRASPLAARLDGRGVALWGAAAAALGFALLAGWGVPVRRALVLLLGLGVGFAARRPLAPLGPLSAAALWILASDPGALFAPGAQLSFAATAALSLGLRGGPWDPGHGAWVQGLRASATALLATAPLAAFHWGAEAPLALVANAVAVPCTALVLLPSALLATLCAAGLASGLLDAAGPASGLLHVPLAVAERVAAFFLAVVRVAAAPAPGSAGGPPPAMAWLVAAGLVGLLGLRLRRTPAKLVAAAGVSGLLFLAPARALLPLPPRLLVLDVSQGDAVLVEGRSAAILVDAGSARPAFDFGRRAVLPALRALGIEKLDLVVASHADLDHRGGLEAVLSALPVAEVWLPRGGASDPDFGAVRRAARTAGAVLRERSAGDPAWRRGDVAVEVLWPPADPIGLDRNDRSLVLRLEVGRHSLLLPGDIERAGEAALLARGAPLGADLLKLPHHGSRSSSGLAFLRAVAPRIAIASAPCRGRWGMPHPEVRARLRALGVSLWWTGRDGAVRVGLGPRLHVVGTGPPRRCDSPAGPR